MRAVRNDGDLPLAAREFRATDSARNPHLAASHAHSPARFRRPRTCAGVEDRGFSAGDKTVVRAGQCRHRAGGRMRGARYRRPCRGDRFLQSATRSISSWSARKRRSRPASSTISRAPASRRSGRAKRRRSSRAPRDFTKALCTEFGIPTGAYGRFTNAADALAYVRAQGAPIVVKADGLAAGKGVVVAHDLARGRRRHRHDVRRRVRRGRRRSRDRGISVGPRDQLLRAVRRRAPRSRWPPRRTTSGCSTTTRARTPAAWAPIRRRRS